MGFGLLAFVLTILLYRFIDVRTDWSPYVTWLAPLSAVTFILYGLDKLLAKIYADRPQEIHVPPEVLTLLALLGGFPGGWLAITLFRDRNNTRQSGNRWFIFILVLSMLGHAVFIYGWLSLS